MSLPSELESLSQEIINSFLARKENIKGVRTSVDELLKKFETERREIHDIMERNLTAFHKKLEHEVEQLLEQFEAERRKVEVELSEAKAVWCELGATMEKLRREDPYP